MIISESPIAVAKIVGEALLRGEQWRDIMPQEMMSDEQLSSMIVTGLTSYMVNLAIKMHEQVQNTATNLATVDIALLRARILNMARALVTVLEE